MKRTILRALFCLSIALTTMIAGCSGSASGTATCSARARGLVCHGNCTIRCPGSGECAAA